MRKDVRQSVQTILTISVVTALCASSTMAAALYVDRANPQCTDLGTGLPAAPYCTINAAAADAVAGDTVVVATGVYSEKVTVKFSGSPSAPIVFTSADGASATVTSSSYAFYISAKSWITIQGFTVSDTGSYGIYAKDSSHITIQNNLVVRAGKPIKGSTRAGIYLNNTSDSLVAWNDASYDTDGGIRLNYGAARNRILGNVTTHNARGYTRASPGIDVRSGGNTIEANISHDNEDSGIQIYNGATDNLVINNLTFNNGDHGIDVLRAGGQRIIGNTVFNNVTAGINVEGGSTGCLVANNVSVDNAIAGPRTRGNIRVDSTSIPGTIIDYDLVHQRSPDYMITWGSTRYTSLTAFVSATGMEAHGIEADPLWVSPATGDFHLSPSSPAIDSANSGASGATDTDLEGWARVDDPGTPDTGAGPRSYDDRGAFEYQLPPALLSSLRGAATR